ncbi:serine/threonine-protein kinase [Mycobacterium seoulense]|uniref:serine/threonine-protein kinase n=1 Tax=Mycobacterium seoulense TaxID=386911 RepID=UPI003CF0FA0E
MEGTPFGRYRLIEMLDRGGMGEVWRAYDTETKRTVAIKVLPPNLAADREFVQRFRREAEAAAQLNSPHVIPIHHYGQIDGRLYVDMRLIDGRDLGALLAEGPLEPLRAVRIVDQCWIAGAWARCGVRMTPRPSAPWPSKCCLRIWLPTVSSCSASDARPKPPPSSTAHTSSPYTTTAKSMAASTWICG